MVSRESDFDRAAVSFWMASAKGFALGLVDGAVL